MQSTITPDSALSPSAPPAPCGRTLGDHINFNHTLPPSKCPFTGKQPASVRAQRERCRWLICTLPGVAHQCLCHHSTHLAMQQTHPPCQATPSPLHQTSPQVGIPSADTLQGKAGSPSTAAPPQMPQATRIPLCAEAQAHHRPSQPPICT
jgi:hypothetical protein